METSSIGRPTFGGIASGLDTAALLDGLLAIERQPLQRIRSRRSEIDGQRSLMRELNTKILKLREAAQKLDNRNSSGLEATTSEEFLRYSASSTNEDVVTVTAGSGAAPGDIDIVINQLARGSLRFSNSFTRAAADDALAVGESFTIDLDNEDATAVPPIDATSITIEATAGSGPLALEDVRDQINTSADNGGTVRADILRVGDDDLQLVLTSTGTGVENQMTITGDLALQPVDDGLGGGAGYDARGSEFEVFGQTITRSSNVVDDVLSGITLRLEKVSDLAEDDVTPLVETVSVEVDAEEVAKSLEEFTKAYNDVVSFIDRQFAYNETTKSAGPLSGDFTLRRIQSQLREMVSTGYAFNDNPNNPFASGSQGGVVSNIGIEIESGGKLKVNREKLDEALALDAISVREFLSGRSRSIADPDDANDFYDEGFAQRLVVDLEEIVRSGDGTLAERDKAYATRLKSFDDSIDRFERRLTLREETLIQRFSELERIVAGLQSQQGFLTGIGA